MPMPQESSVASLALQLRWLSQQLARDLATLAPAERRGRQQEIEQLEARLRQAEADQAAER